MNAHQHATISLIAGLALGITLFQENIIAVTVTALIFGTLIDVDHFLISRVVDGEWKYFRAVMRNPVKALYDVKSVVKESEEFPEEYRYLTHGIIHLTLLTIGLYTSNALAYTAAVASGLHLLSDISADIFMW